MDTIDTTLWGVSIMQIMCSITIDYSYIIILCIYIYIYTYICPVFQTVTAKPHLFSKGTQTTQLPPISTALDTRVIHHQ